MAGIPKQDDRGRTIDVHALRQTFCTLLSQGGVTPRIAQAAMRHSSVDLTMNTYTDARLLDVHGALDVLPDLPLESAAPKAARANGTLGRPDQFAPGFAPTPYKPGPSRSSPGNVGKFSPPHHAGSLLAATSCQVNEKTPLTIAVNRGLGVERKGVEPSTSALRTQRSPN